MFNDERYCSSWIIHRCIFVNSSVHILFQGQFQTYWIPHVPGTCVCGWSLSSRLQLCCSLQPWTQAFCILDLVLCFFSSGWRGSGDTICLPVLSTLFFSYTGTATKNHCHAGSVEPCHKAPVYITNLKKMFSFNINFHDTCRCSAQLM